MIVSNMIKRRNFVYKQMTASRHSRTPGFLHLQQLVEYQPQEKKLMKLFLAVVLAAITVGCGYSSKPTTPAQPGTVPVISQLTPASANSGGPAFTLEVDGSSFGSQATVNFNGASMAATVVNAGKLQAMIPATAIANAGTVNVTVTNPGTPGGLYGGGTQPETSTAMTFTIN
jgi:hypothetical protein